eukprot:COSAG02_NODE_661_length_18757_cov_4.427699_14_plen_51_part_00
MHVPLLAFSNSLGKTQNTLKPGRAQAGRAQVLEGAGLLGVVAVTAVRQDY